MATILKAGNVASGAQITSDSTGILEIKTGTGAGTTAMVLDASQNVGVGTSSPQGRLDVNGIVNVAAGSGVGLRLGLGTAFSGGQAEVYGQGSVPLGIGTAGAQPLNLYTNSVLAARIDTSGNLLVNTTSQQSGGTLSVVATALNNAATFRCADNGANVVRSWMATTSGTRFHIAFGDGSSFTERGVISTNGSTTTYGTGSDYRLKEDVQPMSGALARVAQMRPVTWTWKESQVSGEGFIAHELQAVVPDAVVGEKDAVDENGKPIYQNVDASFVVATLTAAIQELKAELDATKAEVALLKGAA